MYRAVSQQEKNEIIRLADRGFSTGRIATKLGRTYATVHYQRIILGLPFPRRAMTRGAFTRGGVVVRPFTPLEDRFLLGRGDHSKTEMSKQWAELFGYPRTAGALRHRYVYLTALAEAAAEQSSPAGA